MRTIKYVSNNGLAFTEEKEMKKLADYAKQGWILEGFAGLGYKLKKSEPQNIVYSLDYQQEADQEYFSYFETAGWSHVCSAGKEIHIFSAPAGTEPIYSDRETTIEKYEREKEKMGKFTFPIFITTVVFMFLSILSGYGWVSELVGNVSKVLGVISLIILVFPGLPYIAYQFKLHQLRKARF